MKKIKPSQVLRQAAEIIDKGIFAGCCAAIEWQCGVPECTRSRAYDLFSSLYKPRNKRAHEFWFHNGWNGDETPKTQQHRVMALLLAADMCESVGE